MKSKVLRKMVFVSDDDEMCYCDETFYKTCISRIANNLPCQETIIRLTPIDDGVDPNGSADDAGDLMHSIRKNSQFMRTLDHLNRMK